MHCALQKSKRLLHYGFAYLGAMDQQEIGRRLAKARLDAGFKHAKDAAEAMGVPVSTYIGHENGQRGFRYPTAQQYARKFKVNIDWILTGIGEQEAPGLTVDELTEMLREAIEHVVTVETKIADLPRIVAPALHEQIERLQADRSAPHDIQLAASAREGRARSRPATKRSGQEESRNP